jgi:hypothetical protein
VDAVDVELLDVDMGMVDVDIVRGDVATSSGAVVDVALLRVPVHSHSPGERQVANGCRVVAPFRVVGVRQDDNWLVGEVLREFGARCQLGVLRDVQVVHWQVGLNQPGQVDRPTSKVVVGVLRADQVVDQALLEADQYFLDA